MRTYKHTFNVNGSTYEYYMSGDVSHHMSISGLVENDIIFRKIISDTFNINIHDRTADDIIMTWVEYIVGYKPNRGVWPETNTKEDCIKICTELDRVIQLSNDDRHLYLTNIVGSLLPALILTEF